MQGVINNSDQSTSENRIRKSNKIILTKYASIKNNYPNNATKENGEHDENVKGNNQASVVKQQQNKAISNILKKHNKDNKNSSQNQQPMIIKGQYSIKKARDNEAPLYDRSQEHKSSHLISTENNNYLSSENMNVVQPTYTQTTNESIKKKEKIFNSYEYRDITQTLTKVHTNYDQRSHQQQTQQKYGQYHLKKSVQQQLKEQLASWKSMKIRWEEEFEYSNVNKELQAISMLGKGSFATVYEAYDRKLKFNVAVKVYEKKDLQ